MSRALRRDVPLKSRCSSRCAEPAILSSRDPTATHSPIDAERICGIASVTRRTPPMSLLFSNLLRWRQLGRGLGGLPVALVDRGQGQLAVRTDLGDLDQQAVALLHD